MLGSSNRYRVFRKLCFFFILSNTSFANIPLQLIFKVLSSVMRVHSNSYWLAIFWMTNGSPVLKRERWQTTEYFGKKSIFPEHPAKQLRMSWVMGKRKSARPLLHIPHPLHSWQDHLHSSCLNCFGSSALRSSGRERIHLSELCQNTQGASDPRSSGASEYISDAFKEYASDFQYPIEFVFYIFEYALRQKRVISLNFRDIGSYSQK